MLLLAAAGSAAAGCVVALLCGGLPPLDGDVATARKLDCSEDDACRLPASEGVTSTLGVLASSDLSAGVGTDLNEFSDGLTIKVGSG